jgi:hypothetical protein
MSIPQTAAEAIGRHVTLTLESIDRLYLNVIQPRLQIEPNVAWFFRQHRGEAYATAKVMAAMTRAFVADVEQFCADGTVDLVTFERHQRKDDLMQERLKKFTKTEGVVFVGKAQERARVVRTTTRRTKDGRTFPWLSMSTAMVNHYYFYCVDKDFGPFFIKYCSYFPYNAKLCLNGHEYLKCQLRNRGVTFEALDNGIRSCANPQRMQAIANGLSARKIEALWRKWSKILPSPYTHADRKAGFEYQLFMQQIEFARTQVFDRPASGRMFFEQVLKDNLDLGRPNTMQLIFDKSIPRTTKTRYCTRLVTAQVTPSLWLEYKRSAIKQYFKEGRALRTELVVNHTRDFNLGKSLHNLQPLRTLAFAANRRLLTVQTMTCDPVRGDELFRDLSTPVTVDGQRSSGLKFGDPVVLALFAALLMFRHVPMGFRSGQLRPILEKLDADNPMSLGQMTYHLRRLRLRGFIRRVEKSHRYEVTEAGLRAARFHVTAYTRILGPLPNTLVDLNLAA